MSASSVPELLRGTVREVGPYVPGASALQTRARLGRDDLVRLNWNENLLGPLPGVREAIVDALGDVWTYPEEAYDRLAEAVAGWTGARVEEVIPGHGIQALVLALVSAFVEPGDRVIVPRPTYGLYAQACAVAGADVRRVDVGPSLGLDLEAIAAAAAAARAKLVWICDPNNPTGRRLERAQWAAFLDALPGDCVVVADEAYREYVDPDEAVDRLADIRDDRPVIVLRTFSKIFGLAGLRLGYMLVAETLAPHLDAVQEPFNVNCAALSAGLASLRDPGAVAARRVQAARARRRLVSPLRGTGVRAVPSHANFVLLDLHDDDARVSDALARDGILVRAGSEFGLPGHIRVTTADEALMESVGERIAALSRPSA